MKNRKPFILAIAAISGGGKTTITTQLNQKFPKSKALYFDEYEFEGPDDIPGWVERRQIVMSGICDTPLDIAMARRLLRDYKDSRVEDIFNDLDNYLSRGRKAYLNMLNTIKPNSDLIIDGTLSLDEIVNKIRGSINKD